MKASDGLNLRNQKITAESNGHLVTLTKKSVGDSATVKAITLVTLIYLPATFISVCIMKYCVMNTEDMTRHHD
jgi:hypothetical protein